MKRSSLLAVALLSSSIVAGCGGGNDAEPVPEQAAGAMESMPGMGAQGMESMPGMGAQGMEGMPGMGGMQMSRGMMEEMRGHMQMMEGSTGEQLMANLPQHRQMVANMISQMNREMREMNMAADHGWEAMIELIREDLRRLPEMDAEELEAFMPEHRERLTRLMEMHGGMMGGGQP